MMDRLRPLAVGSAITLSLGAVSPADRPCTRERPAIIVLLYDYGGVPAAVLERAKQRVEAVYADAAVAIDWIDPIRDARYRINPESGVLGAFTVQMVLRA